MYIFVSLNELDIPEYHIVPSEVVSETVKKSHQEWLNTLRKRGQKHNDNPMRKFSDIDGKYLNRWDLLE